MNGNTGKEEFARLVEAIEPYLADVVVIGGWAHQLYHLHPDAQPVSYVAVTTLDTDVAVPTSLRVEGRHLRERLMAAGFTEERLGQDNPPATHYRLQDSATGFYAEFLSPLYGPEHERNGRAKATRRVAGVVSQQLRHLEILLLEPWTVTIGPEDGFPVVCERLVRIANPASFLAHKILIQSKRTQRKFAKDILYLHDTLEIFGARIQQIREEWIEKIRPVMHARQCRKVQNAAAELFGEVSDAIREAARMGGARNLSPAGVRERCHFGLHRIFGT